MKKLFKMFSPLMVAFVLFMSLSIGVTSILPDISHAQEEISVEASQASQPANEMPKICKDDQGNEKVCSNEDSLKFLLLSMGGLKGASALAIAFVICKFLLMFILSPMFANYFPSLEKGGMKLLIAVFLNLVVGILALMIPPVSLGFGAAITHSSVLALGSVFGNQAFKYYIAKKGKK